MRKVLIILGQLSDSDAEWMSKAGIKKTISDGTKIITEGEENQSLFILLDGNLSVVEHKLGKLAELGVGEIVGEMSYVDDAPPSASVVAEGSCTVLELVYEDITRRMEHDPAFGMRIYRALSFFLADRLRGTVRRFGYGDGVGLDEDGVLEDELDERLLDNMSRAGERFDRLLKTLASG